MTRIRQTLISMTISTGVNDRGLTSPSGDDSSNFNFLGNQLPSTVAVNIRISVH